MIRTPSLTRQRKKLSAAQSEPGLPSSASGPMHARAEASAAAASGSSSTAPRAAASDHPKGPDRTRTLSGNLLPALTPGSDNADSELQFENVAPNGNGGGAGGGRATPQSKSKLRKHAEDSNRRS